jgi:phosphatidylglycerophosphatase A
MKKRLLEVEYEDIFKPETMAALKGKSGESLRAMLGDKNLMQTMMRSQELLRQIIEDESDYHIELAMIAEIMAREAYPILDYANVKIDAKIVGMGGVEQNNNEDEDEDEDEISIDEIPSTDTEAMEKKRRIINGITQGASVRGSFGFLLFREHLDDLSPELVEKYNETMKLVFGIYDDENAIAMMLAALGQKQNLSGGSSEMVYDETEDRFVIKARAICFPMLFHEIVKGLYEIIGTEGFGSDKEQNQDIIGKVDKVSNEPRDFQYGKFIYDALSNLYNQSNISDARVRELFFAEVYKLGDREFIIFIENLLNNKLSPTQKKWASDTMREIESDLKKDDTGLSGLDEIKKKL